MLSVGGAVPGRERPGEQHHRRDGGSRLLGVARGVFVLVLLMVTLAVARPFPDAKPVIAQAGVLVLGALCLCWMFRAPDRSRPRMSLLGPFLALLGTALMSVLVATDWQSAAQACYQLVIGIVLYAVTVTIVRGQADLEKATLFLSGLGALQGIIGILQLLFPRFFLPSGVPVMAIGTLGNTNYLGGFLATLAPLAVGGAWLYRRWPPRWFSGVSAGLILVTLFLTRARGAWFGLAVGVAALAMAMGRRTGPGKGPAGWRLWAWIGAACGLGFGAAEAVLWLTGQGSAIDRLLTLLVLQDRGAQDRLGWWALGLQLAWSHPLLGVGISNFPTAFFPYLQQVDASVSTVPWINHPHNEILAILCEQGLVGIAVASWLITRTVRKIRSTLCEDSVCSPMVATIGAALLGAGGDSLFFYILRDPTASVVIVVMLGLLEREVQVRRSAVPFDLLGWQLRTSSVWRVGAVVGWLLLATLSIPYGLRPAMAQWHVREGRLALTAQKHERAVSSFRRAVAWDANSLTSHFEFGVALLDIGQTVEGVRSLERALVLDPDDIETKNNLGLAYFATGRRDEALRLLTELVTTVPRYALAQNNLGFLYVESGDTARAEPHLKRAVALFPDQPDARYNLGRIHLGRGEVREALQQLTEATRLAPGKAPYWFGLAQAEAVAGGQRAALRALERAIGLSPTLRQAAAENPSLTPLRSLDEFRRLAEHR